MARNEMQECKNAGMKGTITVGSHDEMQDSKMQKCRNERHDYRWLTRRPAAHSMAKSSSASWRNSTRRTASTNSAEATRWSQYTVSSHSCWATRILLMNSALLRERRASRQWAPTEHPLRTNCLPISCALILRGRASTKATMRTANAVVRSTISCGVPMDTIYTDSCRISSGEPAKIPSFLHFCIRHSLIRHSHVQHPYRPAVIPSFLQFCIRHSP